MAFAPGRHLSEPNSALVLDPAHATQQFGEGQALDGVLCGQQLQQEGGGLIRQRACMPQLCPQVQGAGWAPASRDVSEVESTAGGTGSANTLSHPVGTA